jgi:hypothetical protein
MGRTLLPARRRRREDELHRRGREQQQVVDVGSPAGAGDDTGGAAGATKSAASHGCALASDGGAPGGPTLLDRWNRARSSAAPLGPNRTPDVRAHAGALITRNAPMR